MDEYELTQERMADRVGKKRATVANYLRLLKLPAEIQLGIKEKKIDMGHARAILGSPSPEQQLSIYKRILQNGLSVRKVEELVSDTKTTKKEVKENPSYTQQEAILQEKLGGKAKIVGKKITIAFRNEEELNFILSHIH
jgi:ParB family chromosome partitioning protein